MNLYLRLLYLFLTAPFRKKVAVLDPVLTTLYCLPNDMDINLHMNNGRYFSIMDLGRLDFLLRHLPAWPLFNRTMRPIVVDESIRFRKSIFLFQKFQVSTQIMAWTEFDIYIEQNFITGNQNCARAFIRSRVFDEKGQAIPADDLMKRMGYQGPRKSLMGSFKAWSELPRRR